MLEDRQATRCKKRPAIVLAGTAGKCASDIRGKVSRGKEAKGVLPYFGNRVTMGEMCVGRADRFDCLLRRGLSSTQREAVIATPIPSDPLNLKMLPCYRARAERMLTPKYASFSPVARRNITQHRSSDQPSSRPICIGMIDFCIGFSWSPYLLSAVAEGGIP